MAVYRRGVQIAALLLAVAMAGCTAGRATDRAQAAPLRSNEPPPVPVIFIPGMLGSRLADRETGVEVWPGTAKQLLAGDHAGLALRIDPVTLEPLEDRLIATGVFENAVGKDVYGHIVETLLQTGGYARGHPGVPPAAGEMRLYTLSYDWRRDNIHAVRALDALIEQIRRDYNDPELRVDVIGHSMGGLILRYYERYGTEDVMARNAFPVTGAGVSKLRRIVMLSVPNQGALTALRTFLRGYRIWLSQLPAEGIATMPAMYQLLPHPQVPWITNARGEPLPFDPYDIDIWKDFRWSIFGRVVRRRISMQPGSWPEQEVFERYFAKQLERGRRFAWSLMVPTGDIQLIEPLTFGGDCLPTLARIVVEEHRGVQVPRLQPEQLQKPLPGIDYGALMYEPGDSSVTKASLIGLQGLDPSLHESRSREVGRPSFVCEIHEGVTGNARVLEAILRHLQGAG